MAVQDKLNFKNIGAGLEKMSDLINFGFYLDLLERFKHLKYREFPLVYFLNIQPFFNIINEKRKTISNRQLELVLKNKINEKKNFK